MDEYKTLEELHDEKRPVLAEMSVVIPTLGREILQESLFWIASGTYWPGQVVVVDQGQNDQVRTWLAALESRGIKTLYVPSTERGRSLGLNQGLERVATRFVAITDDDCFVRSDWLENMHASLTRYPEAIVTGQVEAAGDEAGMMVVTLSEPAIYRRPSLMFDVLSGGNMGTSMKVIHRIGFFEEDMRMRTAEDGEYAYRALRSGVSLIYAPDVGVRHYGWRVESDRYRQYKSYARSHGGFYGKYLRKGDWFIALRAILHHIRCMKRSFSGALTGDRDRMLNGWAYLTGLLPGIISGMRKRETQ